VWRVLVVAEPQSKVTLIEELTGDGGYLNGVVELAVADGADVEYVQVQSLGGEAYHFTSQRAEVSRDATLRWAALALGGKLGKARMESKLVGPGATSRVTGLYVLGERQHLDLDTTQEHAAPHTTTDLAFKGALQGRARSVWRGIIKVDEGAQKTDAFQENRNLLLSKRAHADSIPGLQILANDVRCTHAATVSQVDRELLFFLMARGFTRADAQRLIVAGYFRDALERISDESVRTRLGAALEARIA
jgi:Fe-S cluster assembly protein SufD